MSRRDSLEGVKVEFVDIMARGLDAWTSAARRDLIHWGFLVFKKPVSLSPRVVVVMAVMFWGGGMMFAAVLAAGCSENTVHKYDATIRSSILFGKDAFPVHVGMQLRHEDKNANGSRLKSSFRGQISEHEYVVPCLHRQTPFL